jgi:hypothetical protein
MMALNGMRLREKGVWTWVRGGATPEEVEGEVEKEVAALVADELEGAVIARLGSSLIP